MTRIETRPDIPPAVSVKQYIDILKRVLWPVRSKLMGLVLGPPGQGKTQATEQFSVQQAERSNRRWVNIRHDRAQDGDHIFLRVNCSGMAREDFFMPWLNQSAQSFQMYIVETLKYLAELDDIEGVILFDEAPKNIDLNAIYAEIGHERTLGWNWSLHSGILIVMTGNRVEDNAGAYEMTADVQDRSLVLNVLGTAQDFVDHMGTRLSPLFRTACLFFPEKELFDFGSPPSLPSQTNSFRSTEVLNEIVAIKDWTAENGEVVKGWNWSEGHLRTAGAGVVGRTAFQTFSATQGFEGDMGVVIPLLEDPSGNADEIRNIFMEDSMDMGKALEDFKFAAMALMVGRVVEDGLTKDQRRTAWSNAHEFMSIICDNEMTETFQRMVFLTHPELKNTAEAGVHRAGVGDNY